MAGALEPALPPWARKTYSIHVPLRTHWRKATCAEVDCPFYLNGWETTIDEASDLGQMQAAYIRRDSGRGFCEHKTPEGLTAFTFEPGQRCFNSDAHRKQTGRPELYVVRDGDSRGNPRGTAARLHSGADSWLDDFGTHQDKLADRFRQG